MRVPKNGKIRVNTEKWKDLGEYQDKVESVQVSKNCPNQYRKMVEPVSVPENDRIRTSTGEMVESVRVPKNFSNEHRKMVESGSVPKNDRIRASTG